MQRRRRLVLLDKGSPVMRSTSTWEGFIVAMFSSARPKSGCVSILPPLATAMVRRRRAAATRAGRLEVRRCAGKPSVAS